MTMKSVFRRLRPSLVKSALVGAGLSLGFLTLAAAEKPHFESKGLDGAITVDGKFDDWYGNLQPFGSDPVAIQFLNDGQFLYVRVTASDSATRTQIMRMGLTVWFDPGGGTKKKFGIRYPVVEHGQGPDAEGRGGQGGGSGGGGYGGSRGRRGEGPPSEESDSPTDRVDIIGPGKDDARSLTRDHLSGVDVAIRTEQGTLQYELKVPLAKTGDHPYAIETAPGKTIGIGLETGKAPQRSSGAGRGGGMGGGGGGGGMGGMGGGGRGRGGGGGGGGMGRGGGGGGQRSGVEPPKPLKGWGTVAIGPAR
jgi:hypothetical protein